MCSNQGGGIACRCLLTGGGGDVTRADKLNHDRRKFMFSIFFYVNSPFPCRSVGRSPLSLACTRVPKTTTTLIFAMNNTCPGTSRLCPFALISAFLVTATTVQQEHCSHPTNTANDRARRESTSHQDSQSSVSMNVSECND